MRIRTVALLAVGAALIGDAPGAIAQSAPTNGSAGAVPAAARSPSAAPPSPGAPSAVPSAGAPAEPPPPPLAADPPGTEKTPLPTAAEWASAARVSLTRVGPAAAACDAYRVREWLRIKCPKLKTFAGSLLAGNVEGIAFWIDPPSEDHKGSVQFPVRRGDRRIIQLWTFGTDAEGAFAPRPAIVIQEQWVLGDAAPIVTAM